MFYKYWFSIPKDRKNVTSGEFSLEPKAQIAHI